MKTSAFCSAAAAVAALSGAAAAAEPTLQAEASAVFVVGAFSAEDAEPAAARTSLFGEAAWLFGNGVEAAIGVGIAAERDHPTAGALREAPTSCGVRAPVSDAVRCATPPRKASAAAVEALYVRLAAPWGEASVGRDAGVAARYVQRPPAVASSLTLTDTHLSLTAAPAPRVLNDPTGPSAKLSVETPRLLGLKAGASFTPREEEGRDLADGFAAAPRLRLEEVAEGGLSFFRVWRDGLSTNLGATYAEGEVQGSVTGFDTLRRASVGATLERGGWAIGGAYQWSDNGWAAGGRDYRAGAVSLRHARGPWLAGLGTAYAEDDFLGARLSTAQAELGRTLNERVTAVVALRREDAGAVETGVFAEISLKL